MSESDSENEFRIFPSPGLVMGFQYKGQLAVIAGKTENKLSSAGITGITDSYKVFKNSPNIGTVLVYFTEIGFSYFASHPAHELFNQCISLEYLFDKDKIIETEDRLAYAQTDQQRVQIVEQFLRSQLKIFQTDKLVIEAVRLIYQSRGSIRVSELNDLLCVSQSPFEKRFRKLVGSSPKKFASIVRFNSVLGHLGGAKSLTEVCYDNNFFDQAHFIKDFRRYTGDTPENFKRLL